MIAHTVTRIRSRLLPLATMGVVAVLATAGTAQSQATSDQRAINPLLQIHQLDSVMAIGAHRLRYSEQLYRELVGDRATRR